jgi:hypothetical protein
LSSLLGKIIRTGLERFGYVLVKRDYARYGYSLFIDISRISRSWNWSIETVFDVGANVGQFASEALKELPGASIYSFEPFPHSFERLRESTSSERFSPHELALDDRSGEVTL